jgi:hypothetical protein
MVPTYRDVGEAWYCAISAGEGDQPLASASPS